MSMEEAYIDERSIAYGNRTAPALLYRKKEQIFLAVESANGDLFEFVTTSFVGDEQFLTTVAQDVLRSMHGW